MTPYEAQLKLLQEQDAAAMAALPESERIRRLEGSVVIWRTGCHALQQQCDALVARMKVLEKQLAAARLLPYPVPGVEDKR